MKDVAITAAKTATAILGLSTGLIFLIAVAFACSSNGVDEQSRQRYQWGITFPSEVGFDIAVINFDAARKCHKIGLDESECPQSDGNTIRRVMATLMTQTIEQNGPAWQGQAYVPDTLRAMNHRLYDLVLHLETNPCGSVLYTHAKAEILEQLREGQFIYKCGQGWSVTSEWLKALEKESAEAQGEYNGNSRGTQGNRDTEASASTANQSFKSDCDQLLRNQLVFQRGADTADRMQEVIQQIQAQRDECVSELWNPDVDDATAVTGCFTAAPPYTNPLTIKIGDLTVPRTLYTGSTAIDRVRTTSGRDAENNIIVYWSTTHGEQPANDAGCWLYVSRLNQWDENYDSTSKPETRYESPAAPAVLAPIEVIGTPVYIPALTRDAQELERVAEEHNRLLTSLPPTLTAEQRLGQLHTPTPTTITPSTPEASQMAIYKSCKEADAAGEKLFQGVRGKGKGFPEEMVPSAKDDDGDGIVCER